MLDEFLNSIEPFLGGYTEACFSYLAVKRGEKFELSQGRLNLQGVPLLVRSGNFESSNIKAGIYRIAELKQTPKGIIESLLSGKVLTPVGEFNFPPEEARSHSIYFNPFHTDGIQAQRRQKQFLISGVNRQNLNQIGIDWELKAATTPFDNLQDLCYEYSIGLISGSNISVEIAAHNLAAIATDSIVKGTKAHLAIIMAEGLERDKASIGFRVIDKNKVSKRGNVAGTNLTWKAVETIQRGEVEIDVSSGAVIHCIANYNSEAQHHYWVADPTTVQNPRRAVHQAFDDKLEAMQDLLYKSQWRGFQARDFEAAVAWLLWILGFNVTHLGGTQQTSEGPDLIAATPQGHLMVLECTTGILKTDNKLSKLIDRTEKVRQCLASSGNSHLKVLPVIVTNKTREEVKADLELAQKSGVLVGTREVFVELINRTHIVPDADKLYAEAEEAIRRAQNPNPQGIFQVPSQGNLFTA